MQWHQRPVSNPSASNSTPAATGIEHQDTNKKSATLLMCASNKRNDSQLQISQNTNDGSDYNHKVSPMSVQASSTGSPQNAHVLQEGIASFHTLAPNLLDAPQHDQHQQQLPRQNTESGIFDIFHHHLLQHPSEGLYAPTMKTPAVQQPQLASNQPQFQGSPASHHIFSSGYTYPPNTSTVDLNASHVHQHQHGNVVMKSYRPIFEQHPRMHQQPPITLPPASELLQNAALTSDSLLAQAAAHAAMSVIQNFNHYGNNMFLHDQTPVITLPKRKYKTTRRSSNEFSICANCNAVKTPLWRKGESGKKLCNKCGLYWSRHGHDRPLKLQNKKIDRMERAAMSNKKRELDDDDHDHDHPNDDMSCSSMQHHTPSISQQPLQHQQNYLHHQQQSPSHVYMSPTNMTMPSHFHHHQLPQMPHFPPLSFQNRATAATSAATVNMSIGNSMGNSGASNVLTDNVKTSVQQSSAAELVQHDLSSMFHQ